MPEHTPAPTPSRSVYGFAMYLTFKTFFLIYLSWAVLPEKWFEAVGITDMPRRHWSVSIPIFLLTTLTIFAFVIYPSLGLIMTPKLDDTRTIKDQKNTHHKMKSLENLLPSHRKETGEVCCRSKSCGKKQYDRVKGEFAKKCIPPLEDLNILEVSKSLHLKRY